LAHIISIVGCFLVLFKVKHLLGSPVPFDRFSCLTLLTLLVVICLRGRI
jgi:uncharacterized membrane protein YccC